MVRALLVAPVLIAFVTPLAAQEATGQAFETIITAQIDAFGRGDAAAAHAFASPGIQSKFPDPNQFLSMVRQSYGALIHPRSTRFEPPERSALGPVQKVTIIDGAGVAWTAVYSFEQVDGVWRITGCVLIKAPDASA